MEIYSDDVIFIEVHESEIPWLKIFTKRKIKEFSEANGEERMAIWQALDVIEREMLKCFKPEKINIAQFGNYLPHLHWHIMARFKDDSFFPEPMWGKEQRRGKNHVEGMEAFVTALKEELKSVRP
jgi:diadenosine tetraphosphate (Ap4A) HIT family hydrolase